MAQRVRCLGIMLHGVVGRRWQSFVDAGETFTRNGSVSKYLVASFCTARTQTQTPPQMPPPNPSQCNTTNTANTSGSGSYSSSTATDKFEQYAAVLWAVFPRLGNRLAATNFESLQNVPTQLFFFTMATSLPMMFAGSTYVAMYVTAANTYHMFNSLDNNDDAPVTVFQMASNLAPTLLCSSTFVLGLPAPISSLLIGYAAIKLSDDILSSDRYPQWRDALVFSVLGVGLFGLTASFTLQLYRIFF